ncbi:uncharacterized protein LOC133175648 [Saccostrea echinata]|uniref:uncharacterized protein LOC133175648 n=1 Tax=Saccostrea echinata TaxID=191078 RepID=UPI002A806995|nr:uncharacterized protein LOC133175648 [Saccostrea echinata]
MWQRIRDYSSAINFTILNFLRRRNYEQFDENGKESCIENSSDESECDEQWTVECNTPHTDTCAIIDHVEVHNFPEKQKSSSERKESNQKNYDGDTDVKLDVSVGRSHYKNKVLRGPKDDVNEGIHLVPRDVKDVVHSYTQRRYSRLDDENESSEEEDFQLAQSEPKSMFHNAKDFSGKKSRKTKRRKKIAEMTRRTFRGSWKWLKRGVMGYAGGLATANIFMLFYKKE